ncbi:sugar phosphate isomerase/epimerase [Candidatus Bathyarchaeota archaeon]|nr:sugar phosphate isomerase/epimerase [Candidatus Bathyarchaeota archaeon]
MKECSCTIGFRELSWEKTLKILNSIGFKFIEGSAEIPNCHLNYFFNNPDKLSTLFELLKSYNLKVVSVMGINDFAVCKEKIKGELKKVNKQLEFAYEINAEILRVFASHIPDYYIWEEMYTQVVDCLKWLGKKAENFGIKIAMENHGGITATSSQVKKILAQVNKENVGLNLDPANFQVSGQDPVKATMELSDFIIHTHIKDCIMTDKGYRFCEIGAGLINYNKILKILKEKGYSGYLSLEYEDTSDPERGTRQSLLNLRKIIKEI